jgi:hypothetical protein
VHILATSLRAWRREAVPAVPSLSIPTGLAASDPHALAACDAVRLFSERAAAFRFLDHRGERIHRVDVSRARGHSTGDRAGGGTFDSSVEQIRERSRIDLRCFQDAGGCPRRRHSAPRCSGATTS